MYPKKIKELYGPYAGKIGIPEQDVRDIMNFTYNELAKQIRGIEHPRLELTGLGQFLFKHWDIDKNIERYRRMIKRDAYFANQKSIETIDKLLAMKEKVDIEKGRRNDKQKIRDEYYRRKQLEAETSGTC